MEEIHLKYIKAKIEKRHANDLIKNNSDGKACTNQKKTRSCDIDLHPSASNAPAATNRKHPMSGPATSSYDIDGMALKRVSETSEMSETVLLESRK